MGQCGCLSYDCFLVFLLGEGLSLWYSLFADSSVMALDSVPVDECTVDLGEMITIQREPAKPKIKQDPRVIIIASFPRQCLSSFKKKKKTDGEAAKRRGWPQ